MSKFMEEWGTELDEIMEKNGFVVYDYGTSLLSEKQLSFFSVGYKYSKGSKSVIVPVADFDLEEDDVMEEALQEKFQKKVKEMTTDTLKETFSYQTFLSDAEKIINEIKEKAANVEKYYNVKDINLSKVQVTLNDMNVKGRIEGEFEFFRNNHEHPFKMYALFNLKAEHLKKFAYNFGEIPGHLKQLHVTPDTEVVFNLEVKETLASERPTPLITYVTTVGSLATDKKYEDFRHEVMTSSDKTYMIDGFLLDNNDEKIINLKKDKKKKHEECMEMFDNYRDAILKKYNRENRQTNVSVSQSQGNTLKR